MTFFKIFFMIKNLYNDIDIDIMIMIIKFLSCILILNNYNNIDYF